MRFDLKKPCKDCPFIVGSSTNRTLAEGRITEIVKDITEENATFSCHKTINYDERDMSTEQHCAGALIYAKKSGKPNTMLQIAERFGIYDPREINENYPGIIKEDDL